MTAQLQLLSVLLMVLAAALMIGGARLRARKRWRIECHLRQYLIAGLALHRPRRRPAIFST